MEDLKVETNFLNKHCWLVLIPCSTFEYSLHYFENLLTKSACFFQGHKKEIHFLRGHLYFERLVAVVVELKSGRNKKKNIVDFLLNVNVHFFTYGLIFGKLI